jgi:hypothetical protein
LTRQSLAASIAFALLTLLVPARPAWATDLAAYRAAIATALAAVEVGDTAGATAALDGIGMIELTGGATMTPDLSQARAALTAQPPDLDAAGRQLASLLDLLDRVQTGVDTRDSDDPNVLLRDVLARDEFGTREDDPDPSPWNRFWSWVWTQLQRALTWIGQGGEGSGNAGWALLELLFAATAVGAIGGLIYWVTRAVRRQMAPEVIAIDAGAPEARLSSFLARGEAERLLHEGQFRAALRMLYLATLLRWEEAGRLRFDRSLTNREVLDQAATRGDTRLVDRLTPLVDRFDRIWYGDLTCSADDYHSFARLAERAWEPSP